MLTNKCSVLGLRGLQRLGLRRHREPAPEMHGWACAAARAREYRQLPPLENAEARHESAEAKVENPRRLSNHERRLYPRLLGGKGGERGVGQKRLIEYICVWGMELVHFTAF